MKLHYKHTKYASYIGYITQAIINNLPPLLFLIFQKEFHISLNQISILVSLNFGVQIITDMIAVKVVDKIGYRICIVTAHILSFIGVICLGVLPYFFSNGLIGLIIAMIINAIGGGLIEVLISPIVEALPGDEKSADMSLLHSFYCIGHVGVVLVSTLYFVLIGTSNWRYLTIFWAVVPLLNAFLFSKVPLKVLVEEEHRTSLKTLFKQKMFWIFMILMICAGASEQAMSQWASLFAESGLKVSKTVGDLLGPCAFALLMAISRIFYGKMGTKINLNKFISYSCVLCFFSYLLAVFSPYPLLSLIGCSLCGLSVGIMWPGVFSLSSQYNKYGGTAMFGILALAGDIGCAAGPGLVGVVSNYAQTKGLDGVMKLFHGNSSTEIGIKIGLLCAIIFPILMLVFIPKKKRVFVNN